VIVLGSAGARNVPDGFPRETALEQIVDFLGLCSVSSTRHGVAVAVEPLCRAESNIVNTVAEADRLVVSAALPGVGLLADTFHMEQEGEPLSAIEDAAPRILHVHTAGRGRRAPGPGDDWHAALFDVCRSLAPQVRLSVECSWDDWETESRMAVAHLSEARDRLVSP
jgi:sugar phosphate isomerase/epimerase